MYAEFWETFYLFHVLQKGFAVIYKCENYEKMLRKKGKMLVLRKIFSILVSSFVLIYFQLFKA